MPRPPSTMVNPFNTTSSIFGNEGPSAPQTQSSLFGGGQQQQQQQQPASSMFGATQQQQPASNMFGATQQQQPASNMFGATQQQQPAANSFFGNPQQQQPAGGLFGGGQQQAQQQPAGASLFGGGQQQPLLSQSQQQQQQPGNSLWQPGQGMVPRQKAIPEQFKSLAEKWHPESPLCSFQHYFYNYVGEDRAPFFRPPPGEDERKWEEALDKKPGPGYIPVRAVGFEQVGMRLQRQMDHLMGYNMRLHEINEALNALLQKHDVVISVRTLAAKRKHQALSHRCLVLATKVQVLRNRGYAMSGDEEDLKGKLLLLERGVFEPGLGGRGEEIWARMMAIRERATMLQQEMERSARETTNGRDDTTTAVDESTLKKAAKILDDYASQLAHLKKELGQIQTDFKEWEISSSPPPSRSSSLSLSLPLKALPSSSTSPKKNSGGRAVIR